MPRHRPEPSFDQYSGEKTGAIVVGVILVRLLVGVGLIISGLAG